MRGRRRGRVGDEKKRATAGQLIWAYLDEGGFSPSQPVNARWTLPGRPQLIPSEPPRGRRLNALAALVADGPHPSFTWDHAPRTLTAPALLAFVRALPRAGLPLCVVLDTGSIHVSRVVQAAEPDLAAEGITFFRLPPDSPKLNAIEAHFRGVKHDDLPERTYASLDDLGVAVDRAFARVEDHLLARSQPAVLSAEPRHQSRRAA